MQVRGAGYEVRSICIRGHALSRSGLGFLAPSTWHLVPYPKQNGTACAMPPQSSPNRNSAYPAGFLQNFVERRIQRRLQMCRPLRVFRRDVVVLAANHLEFVGENTIDHTPKDETIRVYTGNAFDVVGERKRTNYHVDSSQHWMDESFEIRIRNHKKDPVDVRAVEHLYRWTNWKLTQQSADFKKKDAQTIEFPVTVAPNGEQVITYTVHYSW